MFPFLLCSHRPLVTTCFSCHRLPIALAILHRRRTSSECITAQVTVSTLPSQFSAPTESKAQSQHLAPSSAEAYGRSKLVMQKWKKERDRKGGGLCNLKACIKFCISSALYRVAPIAAHQRPSFMLKYLPLVTVVCLLSIQPVIIYTTNLLLETPFARAQRSPCFCLLTTHRPQISPPSS